MARPRPIRARFVQGLRATGRRIGPAVPFALKTGAAAGGGFLLLRGGRDVVRAWGDRHDEANLEQSVVRTPEGAFARSPGGGLFFVPNSDYLDALAKSGNEGPVTLDQPRSEGQEKQAKIVDSLTDPITLLIIGLIVIGAIYIRRRR